MCFWMTQTKMCEDWSISHESIRHFESFACCFYTFFLRISLSSLEPLERSVGGSHTVSTCKQVSRTFATPSTPSQTRSSCDWGVKGVGNQIVWYFRDHSQTNHKLTGTPYFYVKYVRRDLTNKCVFEWPDKNVWRLGQSRIRHFESFVCCFSTFFSPDRFVFFGTDWTICGGVAYRQHV